MAPPLPAPSRLLALLLTGTTCLVLGLGIAQGGVDRWLLLHLNAHAHDLAHTASVLSVLGLGSALIILAAAVGPRRPLVPATALCLVLGSGLMVQLLTYGLAQPRPLSVVGPLLQVIGTAFTTRAMPSGHAALFAAMAAWVCLASPREHAGVLERWCLPALAVLVALGGALARSLVGVHWPSDLLVGAGVGLVWAAVLRGTGAGLAFVTALAGVLASRAGSRAMVALVSATSAALWVSERDYPLAEPWYGALAALGLLSAWNWWQLHPAPWPTLWRNRRAGVES